MNAVIDHAVDLEGRVLDHIATAVLLLDNALCVQFMNPAAEMMFALSERQARGQRLEGLLQCPEGLVNSYLTQAVETGQPVTEREIPLILPDGRALTVDCTVVPLPEREGPPGLLLELQQVDRHLRISREEQLLSQQQVTRDVVRGLAHEIKNPLGGLRGAAQLLQAELDDRELREYTEIIIQEADRLQNLVNRILGPNRLPEYQPVNLHSVMERVRSLVAAEVGGRIALERDYDPSIPSLVADADQLIQAVLNVVRNAARVVPDQGRIVLRTRVQRQFTIGNIRHRLVAQIDIIDNGPGVPEEIRDSLFYPLVTSGTGGLGMGLSIAQSLINQHRGLIECASRPGETVFTIYLPVET
ncbi:MAG: nitrogen regulation protein NR(II) [Gammaproteobacteria bacterium]|jgi:two-component system nitrogen regulation sensor histidine kinase GlnL